MLRVRVVGDSTFCGVLLPIDEFYTDGVEDFHGDAPWCV
jgi:hypothetical protein